jgi:hypothetical protein
VIRNGMASWIRIRIRSSVIVDVDPEF